MALATPQGDAIQIPLARFLHDVLPALPSGVVPNHMVEKLITSGSSSSVLKPITTRGRWRGFAQDPADSWQHEKESFRHLKGIVHSILKVGGRPSSMTFYQTSSGPSSSRGRRDECFPDSLLLAQQKLDWNDVVTFGELRKNDAKEDVQENQSNITSSMANCFHHDPRRRFLYAYTIENTNMRLWFCDRSQLIVSDAFNFITDHQPVVHFFSSMLFAKPEQYGLDPTMKRLGSSQQYDLTVQPATGVVRTFRTLEQLHIHDADFLYAPGTRVWKVTEIKDGEETDRTMVLKDSWVEPGRQQEGSIYEQFYRATDAVSRDSTPPSPFLTVECHGDVYSDGRVREVLDCTRPLAQAASSAEQIVKSRNELIDTEAAPSRSEQPGPSRFVHYRIVFQELGKPLDRETSLSKIFGALSHTVLALREMHKAGWVHCDVSTGNILLTDDGHVLLGDFEYARKMGEGEELRVGTPSFMAVEVANDPQRYGRVFQNELPAPHIMERYPEFKTRYEKRAADMEVYRAALADPFSHHLPPSPRFRYNPLHDLESVWWIAMYFVIKKEIVDPRLDSDVVIASEAQRDYASKLFRYHDEMCRSETLFLNNEFLKGMQTLPKHVMGIVRGLKFLRNELWERYSAEEADPSMIDHTSADGLHERFHAMFQNIANAEETIIRTVRPFTYVPHFKEDVGSGWCPIENCPEGTVPFMWRPYRGRGFYTPTSSGSLRRSISATPSDPSIDYDLFQEAKRVKLMDPAQAGAENRVRPYLARRAKTRTQNRSRKEKERKTKR